jgi:hypothetical protein
MNIRPATRNYSVSRHSNILDERQAFASQADGEMFQFCRVADIFCELLKRDRGL